MGMLPDVIGMTLSLVLWVWYQVRYYEYGIESGIMGMVPEVIGMTLILVLWVWY